MRKCCLRELGRTDYGTALELQRQLIAERQGFTPVVIKGGDALVGIVTVHAGPSLAEGEIIAPVVGDDPAERATYHNMFQVPERYLAACRRHLAAEATAPLLADRPLVDGAPGAYVCRAFTCLAPVTDPAALA